MYNTHSLLIIFNDKKMKMCKRKMFILWKSFAFLSTLLNLMFIVNSTLMNLNATAFFCISKTLENALIEDKTYSKELHLKIL